MCGKAGRHARAATAVLCVAVVFSCQEENVTRVIGKAGNAKMGAAVVSDTGVYYIDGLDEWPAELEGRTVEATGQLEVVHHPKQDPALPSTAMEGPQQVLTSARWKRVKE